jgi:Na+-translocating ferredoxin:NAD+ oxidoreductase RnfC subunit
MQREAEAEAERRKREFEEEQRRWGAAERRKKERQRVNALLEDATSWTKAETLRTFIAAVERNGARSNDTGWFTWARQIADALDPLVESEVVDWEEPEPYYRVR